MVHCVRCVKSARGDFISRSEMTTLPAPVADVILGIVLAVWAERPNVETASILFPLHRILIWSCPGINQFGAHLQIRAVPFLGQPLIAQGARSNQTNCAGYLPTFTW